MRETQSSYIAVLLFIPDLDSLHDNTDALSLNKFKDTFTCYLPAAAGRVGCMRTPNTRAGMN